MSTPDKQEKTVFISHSSEDAAQAQRICKHLEDRGISCWIAPRDVRPGRSYGEEIINGIQNANALVLVMTGNANASRPVANEVERAFSNSKLIIPFRLQDVDPSSQLEFYVAQAQWIDAFGKPMERSIDDLARALESSMVVAPMMQTPSPAPDRFKLNWLWKVTLPIAAACLVAVVGIGLFLKKTDTVLRNAAPIAAPGRELAVSPASRSEADLIVPKYQALVIGINDYDQHKGEGWNRLKTARADAVAMAELLKDKYNFQVRTLLDHEATRGAIMDALDGLVSYGDNDACIVYYAGHGFYDESLGEGYWIPCDARKTNGARSAKEDWLWNSMITKIISASSARHILVIADSCYGGSLFRGDGTLTSSADMHWYRRAIVKSSRYLIASGDIEPVLDGSAKHSVFAQQILGFLEHPDKDIFSASELGMSLRERVSALTGQMVQMGPLAVGGHTGGEFVFVDPDSAMKLASVPIKSASGAGTRGGPTDEVDTQTASGTKPEINARQLLRDAMTLAGSGATNAAHRLLSMASSDSGNNRMVQAVNDYLDQSRQAKARSVLNELISTLGTRKVDSSGTSAPAVRPRILACLGPKVRSDSPDAESLAMLYRICLRSDLAGYDRMQIVEREALQDVLGEMDIGSSDIADPRVRTTIGKLLPAGMLLLGDIFVTTKGENVFMRLVDTETSRVFGDVSEVKTNDEEITDVCARLARKIVTKAIAFKPLTAPAALDKKGNLLHAGIGKFHGLKADMDFVVVERLPGDAKRLEAYRENVVGTAQPVNIDEMRGDFEVVWQPDMTGKPPSKKLWVKEKVSEL